MFGSPKKTKKTGLMYYPSGWIEHKQTDASPFHFPLHIVLIHRSVSALKTSLCGLTTEPHPSVWTLSVFGFGSKTESWATAMSWKLVNLVLNPAKDDRSDTDKHDSSSVFCSIFLSLYSAPSVFISTLSSPSDSQQVGFLTSSTLWK